MRRIRRHIQRLWEADGRIQFFTPHRRVIEPLEVDDKNFGEAIDCQVFLDIDLSLAFRTFKSSLNHAFRLDKFVKALAEFY